MRNAVWVRKTRLGIPYWGWDWDFSVHRKASALTNLKIRFFYNRPDYLTFPIFNLVGRSKSLAWQKEVNQNGVSRGVTTHIEHFKCSDSRVAQCGPGHKQREVLWSFADPAQSIPWNSELQTPPSGNEGRAAMARAAFLPESADLALEPKQMPEVVCVDMTQHADYCRRNFNPEGLAQRESPDQGPLFLCSDPEDLDHPCSQINASDGMCSLVERDGREFERECYFPKYLTFCQCVGGNCEKTVVSCRNEICDVNSSAADDCSCRVNSQPVTCDPRADYCRIETGREGGACLRAQTFSADPGSARSEICRDEQCLTADPALERADALPQGVRAFGGAERFDQLPASSEVEPR